MTRHFLFDREGQPITPERFTELLMLGLGYKVVALTPVEPYTVSTVWLGVDHSLGRGKPVLFETMAYDDTGNFLRDQWRYCTEREAAQGHAAFVDMLKTRLCKPVKVV